ncbi:MAG: FliI/YscN family ATPase [Leptospiraceae bacterium]|nr:FliI/YscN family ATPase [Leptospiraceae bacterium]MCP5499693.1 FliI/YscN family ATPase [Leptospiraceae bacterium]
MIEKKFNEKVDIISKYLMILNKTETIRKSGQVVEVVGNVIYSEGPPDSRVGEIMDVEKSEGRGYLQCQVVGFKAHRYALMPLGDLDGIFPSAFVFSSGRKLLLPVGNQLLGRVLDGNGKPIDGKGLILSETEVLPDNEPPNPLDRPVIKEKVITGVRAIDGLLTVGRGQRLGIFSGSGVGKSTLLGMIARYTNADVNVIALVGERGREVNEFLENELGLESMVKTVVFVATSDSSKMQQINCAMLATSAAEYFREKGLHVNLMMDSLTRFAQAAREIAVSFGEPAITRGYSASVFTKLSRLIERSGTSKNGGSITGFYTVLTEPDEMNDPIADAVRGFIDGHIVLSRVLAEKNHYPAVDVPGSISRVMPKIVSEEQNMYAGFIRELISTYKSAEDLIRLNAYVKGSDSKVDMAIDKKELIDNFLKQHLDEKSSFGKTLASLKDIFQSNIETEEYY